LTNSHEIGKFLCATSEKNERMYRDMTRDSIFTFQNAFTATDVESNITDLCKSTDILNLVCAISLHTIFWFSIYTTLCTIFIIN